MFFSVIINNHNYGRFIAEAIESVLKQTYKDFELIIVDGASTDNSREVINKYVTKYPDIITAVFKPTSGQAAALNVGWRLAKGKVLAFLDSDDYWFDNKLDVIAKHHSMELSVASFFQGTNYTADEVRYLANAHDNLLRYGIYNTGGVTTSCISIGKSTCDEVFPIPEDMLLFADNYILLKLTYLNKLKFIPNELTYYRIHESNAFGQKTEDRSSIVRKILISNVDRFNKDLLQERKPLIPLLDLDLYKQYWQEFGVKLDDKAVYTVYGAGNTGAEAISLLEELGINIKFICDSSDKKWGTCFCGLEVVSPETLLERRNEFDIVLVASLYSKQIIDSLMFLGFDPEREIINLPHRLLYPLAFDRR